MPGANEVTPESRARCFLPERKYLAMVSTAIAETLAADAADPREGAEGCSTVASVCDDDLDRATELAIEAGLSGAEAEKLALGTRQLGAESATECLEGMQVAYASCVRELHANGHSEMSKELLVELILQLVDPIRELPRQTAAMATLKVAVEILAIRGYEIDVWTAPLHIRVFHPDSRMGAALALLALISDRPVQRLSDREGCRIEFEAPAPRKTQPQSGGALQKEWWGG